MPFTILVVCLGNVCRSPQAERLLRMRLDHLLGERSAEVVVESAGVRALVGSSMDPASAAELVRLGGDAGGFVSRQVSDDLVNNADLVLTATKELRSRVLEDVPSALKRTFTLTELAALVDGVSAESPEALLADAVRRRASAQPPTYDLADPIGATPEVHAEVAAEIDRCTRAVAGALAASWPGSATSVGSVRGTR